MITVALYGATVLVWGFSWYAIELQLGHVPAELSVAYRFGLAAALQFAWCAATGVRLRLTWAQHRYVALVGVLLFGFNLLMVYFATARLPSGLVSVVFSLITVVNIVNARLMLGRQTTAVVWLATALGLGGIALVFRADIAAVMAGRGDPATLAGIGLAFAGAVLASFGNVLSVKVREVGLSILQLNTWGMLYGAACLFAFAVVQGAPITFDVSVPYIGGLAYLAVFGSVAGFGFYLTLIKRIGPERAGYCAVMFPAVALMVSVWLEGLKVDVSMLAGAALILVGNVLVLLPRGVLAKLFKPRPA
ncbi:MAG: EamA family transporter [Rhodospirillaceae bacterium]|nr:EamA family transporter [Rhodospirillaceae bacterium]